MQLNCRLTWAFSSRCARARRLPLVAANCTARKNCHFVQLQPGFDRQWCLTARDIGLSRTSRLHAATSQTATQALGTRLPRQRRHFSFSFQAAWCLKSLLAVGHRVHVSPVPKERFWQSCSFPVGRPWCCRDSCNVYVFFPSETHPGTDSFFWSVQWCGGCNAPLVFVDLDTPPQTLSYALVDVSAACCVMADRVLIFGDIGPLHRVFSKNWAPVSGVQCGL